MGPLTRRAGAVAAAALLAAGCDPVVHRGAAGATTTATAPSTTTTTTAPTTTTTTVPTTTTTTVPTTTTTTVPTTTTLPAPQPGWTVVAETSRQIVTDTRTYRLPDGHSVTLVRFHAGTYRLDLHLGGEDPPTGGAPVAAVEGDAVSRSERPRLLGAFNGGFKTATGSGGVEADGHVFVPLVAGDASLVIDADGTVRIGTWGQGLPGPAEHVVSVRQNLTPLIRNGTVNPTVGDVAAWGAELYGIAATARSAVGTDPAGDLVYAGSMAALPADLATALRRAGVTAAMELDLNPEWVQADVAAHPGGPLRTAVPGQQRPADTYLTGWTRDFFTVLAR